MPGSTSSPASGLAAPTGPQLLRLPTEILDAICEACSRVKVRNPAHPGLYVRHHVLLQLVQTCSALRAVAQPWLYRHPQLGWSENGMLSFLYVLVDRPDLGAHVRELSWHTKIIRQRQPQQSLLIRIADRFNSDRPGEPPVLLPRRSRVALPSTYEEDIMWQLLVRLAPRLTALTFASRCEMPMFIHHEPKLRYLESLTIKCDCTDMTPWTPSEPPRRLESCPIVRTLSIGSEARGGAFASVSSDSVTRVDLSWETNSFHTLWDVCTGMPNLQSLRVVTPRTAGYPDFARAYSALQQCKDTLRELCLIISPRAIIGANDDLSRLTDVARLDAFTVLEDLALFTPIAWPWRIGLPAVNFLPRSLRRLSLNCDSDGILDWLLALLGVATEQFPNLCTIAICGDEAMVDEVCREISSSTSTGQGEAIDIVRCHVYIPSLSSFGGHR